MNATENNEAWYQFELRNLTFFFNLEQSAAFQIISCKRFIRVTMTMSFHNNKNCGQESCFVQ